MVPIRGPILYVARPAEGEDARALSSTLKTESNSESERGSFG